jgi:choice-of-anchor C domain-containing protein
MPPLGEAHMSLRVRVGVRLLALSLLLSGPQAARANLLVNGSLESGTNPGASLSLAAGSTAIDGWVVTRGGIQYVGTAWTAGSGFRSAGLNRSTVPGGLAQTFSTLPHAVYSVRFYMAGDADAAPAVKHMSVTAAGQTGSFDADLTGMWAWDPGWNPHMWSFTATSLSTTIEFYSTMSVDAGPAVDSVSVEVQSTAGVPFLDPAAVSFAPIFPNPARGGIRLEYTLPRAMSARLSVFDLAGREVAVLAAGPLPAGLHEATWDGAAGRSPAAPGVYLVLLRTDERRIARRVVLIQ